MVDIMKIDMAFMKKDKTRGYVFLLSLVTMLVLSLLGLLSIRAASASLFQANREYVSAQSLALAEGSLDIAEAHYRKMVSDKQKPTSDVHYPNQKVLGGGVLDANLMLVTNPANPITKNQRIYATAYSSKTRPGAGTTPRKIVAEFADQSFSVYGYFEDTGLGNNWWVSNISHFDGPFHTNGKLQISWSSSAAREIFNGPVSSVNGAITYYSSQSAPTTTANWQKIFAGGLSSFTPNDRVIPFPTDATVQKAGAMGSTTYPDTSTAALIQTNADVKVPLLSGTNPSGVYIVTGKNPAATGNDYPPKIYFTVDGQGRQVVTIKHSVWDTSVSPNKWVYKTTELTLDIANSSTSKRSQQGATVDSGTWSSVTSYPDLINGVLYSDKGINALEGTLADNYVNNGVIVNANSWTVTTDYSSAAKKNITISDNLEYLHKYDATKQPTDPLNLRVPYMGVVANAIALSAPKPPVWAASATRAVGDKIWPSGSLNGHYYLCTQAGKSNTSAPSSWSTTDGATVTDGTARWTPIADDMTVDGVLMGTGSNGSIASGGSVYTQAQVDGQKRGAMTINGGTIVKTAAIIGEFNGSTTTKGYDENYKYDSRMANGPLSAFPSTDSVSLQFWQIVY